MSHQFKTYDPTEIESIKMTLETQAKEGKPLYFEVKVDGILKIHKTNRLERFDEMYNFINENSKQLIIAIYPFENNNRKEWYKYNLNGHEETLSGESEVERKVNEQMKIYEEKMAAKRVEEKLKDTQEKLQHAEDYIDILETKLEKIKSKPNHFGNFDLGKFAGSTIKEIAIHYPKVLDKVPVLNGIAEVIREEESQQPRVSAPSFEGEVSFKTKSEHKEQSEHTQAVQRLSDFIGEHFDEKEKRILESVIMTLGENTSQLKTVAELLNINVGEVVGQ